jgi:hypothetical protein
MHECVRNGFTLCRCERVPTFQHQWNAPCRVNVLLAVSVQQLLTLYAYGMLYSNLFDLNHDSSMLYSVERNDSITVVLTRRHYMPSHHDSAGQLTPESACLPYVKVKTKLQDGVHRGSMDEARPRHRWTNDSEVHGAFTNRRGRSPRYVLLSWSTSR